MTPKRVGIVGAEGVSALHFAAPIDALLAAALDDGYGNRLRCYSICTIGFTAAPFRTSSGLRISTEHTLATAPELDTIIVPSASQWQNSDQSEILARWLVERAATTRRIAAICTAVYPLALSGLLHDREVTVDWRFATDLARRWPTLRVDHRKRLVQDGPFYTSSGLAAGMNLALTFIEEDYGRFVARTVADQMQVDAPPHEQAPEHDPRMHPSSRFGELVSWMMRNLSHELSVDILARRIGMSQETFGRSFKSVFGVPPSEFVENLRLNEARRRLSAPNRTLETVAASVGYENSDRLSRAFERRFGVSPRECLSRRRQTRGSLVAK